MSLLAGAALRAAERGPAALCVVGSVNLDGDPSVERLRAKGRFFHAPATLRVEDYFAAADVFVLPAFYEEFGLTALEALASGCPVILGSRVGAAEILTGGGDGVVIREMTDPEELAAAILAPHKLDRVAARRTAEKYTWERHVEGIVGVYREIL